MRLPPRDAARPAARALPPVSASGGRLTPDDARLLALPKSKEVKALLRQPGTAVYVCRRDGFIVWASPGFKELFGHDPTVLPGRNAWEIFPAKDDLVAAAEASAQLTQGDIMVWLRLLRADGSKDWFHLRCLNREDGVILAFQREDDPQERHFHFHPLGR